MDLNTAIPVWGLIALAAVTLVWCIYHAGKSDNAASEAVNDVKRIKEEERAQDELEKQSKTDAREAIAVGERTGAAPSDPSELPDEVRSRILKP